MTAVLLPGAAVVRPARAGSCANGTLILLGDLCAPAESQVEVTLRMFDVASRIGGVQAFLEYSADTLTPVAIDRPDFPSEFQLILAADMSDQGRITYAVGVVPPSSGTRSDSDLGVITFEILSDDGDRFVRFRNGHEPPTLLASPTGAPTFPVTIGIASNRVDLRDFAEFQNCYHGNDSDAGESCACPFDRSKDALLGLVDFSSWLSDLTGPVAVDCP